MVLPLGPHYSPLRDTLHHHLPLFAKKEGLLIKKSDEVAQGSWRSDQVFVDELVEVVWTNVPGRTHGDEFIDQLVTIADRERAQSVMIERSAKPVGNLR